MHILSRGGKIFSVIAIIAGFHLRVFGPCSEDLALAAGWSGKGISLESWAAMQLPGNHLRGYAGGPLPGLGDADDVSRV